MLGKRNMRDSIGYVTLGLFSHAVLKELLEAESNPSTAPERRNMINLSIDSLLALDSPDEIKLPRLADLVFQDYQEITTLQNVFKTHRKFKRSTDLKEALENIVRDDSNETQRTECIRNVISFFKELALKAIINAETPEERVPPGVRQVASSRSFAQLYAGS